MKRVLFLLITLAACKTSSLPKETLNPEQNKLFCRGASELIEYLKGSEIIKGKYRNYLKNSGHIGLRPTGQVINGILFESLLEEVDQQTSDPNDYKELETDCEFVTDKSPDFDLMFYFLPDRKVLIASIMTILDKPGYRSGFFLATKLNNSGQIGKVKFTEISE